MGAKPSSEVLPETSHDLYFIAVLLAGPFVWFALERLLTKAIFYTACSPLYHSKLIVQSPTRFKKVIHHLLYVIMFVETGISYGILSLPEIISSWGEWDPMARSWAFDRAFLLVGATNWTFYLWDWCAISYGAWQHRRKPAAENLLRVSTELLHHSFYLLAGALAFFKFLSYSVTILYMLMDVIEIPMRFVLMYYQLCTNTNLRRKLFWLRFARINYYCYMVASNLFPGLWLHAAWHTLPVYEKVLFPMLMLAWLPAQAQTAIVLKVLIVRVSALIEQQDVALNPMQVTGSGCAVSDPEIGATV
jgi:hypothetical protein